MDTKHCPKCGEDKPTTNKFFGREKDAKDGLAPYCKVCKSAIDKVYREKNKAKVNEQKRAYYRDNAERIKEKSRNYYEDNRQERIAKSVAYKKQRRRDDPTFRLRERISNAIYCVLFRDNHTGKRSSTWEHLPYTPVQLREHIESQFEDWMTWDNYGSHWHIDHIYPQSRLPYDSFDHPNFQKCWALENLQPLEKFENLRKSNKIIFNKLLDKSVQSVTLLT